MTNREAFHELILDVASSNQGWSDELFVDLMCNPAYLWSNMFRQFARGHGYNKSFTKEDRNNLIAWINEQVPKEFSE